MGNTGTQDQAAPVLAAQAATPLAGTALVNGTPNLLQWTAPNDGQVHSFNVAATAHVTLALTGGQIQVKWTSAGVNQVSTLLAGGEAAGTYVGLFLGNGGNGPQQCDPGTTVTIQQTSAVTAGAAVLI